MNSKQDLQNFFEDTPYRSEVMNYQNRYRAARLKLILTLLVIDEKILNFC